MTTKVDRRCVRRALRREERRGSRSRRPLPGAGRLRHRRRASDAVRRQSPPRPTGCPTSGSRWQHFDLRPGAIVRDLDLRRPIYRKTAAYGHLGRTDSADSVDAPTRSMRSVPRPGWPRLLALSPRTSAGTRWTSACTRSVSRPSARPRAAASASRSRRPWRRAPRGDDGGDEAVDALPLRRRNLGERPAAPS